MFKRPFSFKGRIRRLEYGISLIIFYFTFLLPYNIGIEGGLDFMIGIFVILFIPSLWFIIAQSTKRCHDLGDSGWYQLIPFYGFLLIFSESKPWANKYGNNPKGIQIYKIDNGSEELRVNEGGYQGGYSGGHNSTTNYSSTQNQSKEDGYNSGELYN